MEFRDNVSEVVRLRTPRFTSPQTGETTGTPSPLKVIGGAL